MSLAVTFLVLLIISFVVYKLNQPEKQEIDLINSVIYMIKAANKYGMKGDITDYRYYIYIYNGSDVKTIIEINSFEEYIIIGDIRLTKPARKLFLKEFKKVSIQINMSKLIT
jgi:hypothetical protein